MPPVAVMAAKAAVNRAEELSLEAGLEFERRNFYLLFDTEDAAEGMAAFTEKRTPTLEGSLMGFDRDLGDEPAPAWRDTAPDILSPIDDSAPVSGHVPASDAAGSPARAGSTTGRPPPRTSSRSLRPEGTHGTMLAEIDSGRASRHEGMKKHALPLVDPGPAGLAVVYALREPAYDVLSTPTTCSPGAIDAAALRDTAMDNLRAWSATAPWSDEVAGERRLISSDTGEGGDAARILLPEVREHLAGECGGPARVLVAAARPRPAHRRLAAARRPRLRGTARGVRRRRRRGRARADRPWPVRARRRAIRARPLRRLSTRR